jgi:hypothetical protein
MNRIPSFGLRKRVQLRTPPKTVNGAIRQKQSGSEKPAAASKRNSVASGG